MDHEDHEDRDDRRSRGEARFHHRIVLGCTWLLITIALLRYPGSEGRCFFVGMIIGSWPFLFLGLAAFAINKVVVFAIILALSGGGVGWCAWSADSARLPRDTMWGLLLAGILVGGVVSCSSNRYSFGDWKNSPSVSAATESQIYEPTWQKYHEAVTIPRTLAGAMLGFDVAVASVYICSIAVKASARGTDQAQPV